LAGYPCHCQRHLTEYRCIAGKWKEKMMTVHKPTRYSPCWPLVFLIATLCWSQTGTGNIQGSVKDASGSVVPEATVVLVHTATNRKYTTETNDVGFYLFPSVELGDYQLTITSAGMETWKGQFHLLAGQTAEVNVALKVGTTATSVDVADVTPLV